MVYGGVLARSNRCCYVDKVKGSHQVRWGRRKRLHYNYDGGRKRGRQ
jgi:hypothetical protein